MGILFYGLIQMLIQTLTVSRKSIHNFITVKMKEVKYTVKMLSAYEMYKY